MLPVSPGVTDDLFQIPTLLFSLPGKEKHDCVPCRVPLSVPSAEPRRPYWYCSSFHTTTTGIGGPDTGFKGHQPLGEKKNNSKSLFLVQLQGHPYALWKDCWWIPWNENACVAHVILPCYLSKTCQENVYTITKWECWSCCWFVEKLNHQRRISQTIQGELGCGCAVSCGWERSFDHFSPQSSLSLVLGWTNSQLFLQTAHITDGLAKLTLRQVWFWQTAHLGSGSLREAQEISLVTV